MASWPEYALWLVGSILMGALSIVTYLARAHRGGKCLDGNDVIRGLIGAAVLFAFSIISLVYTEPERGPILDHAISAGFVLYMASMIVGYLRVRRHVRENRAERS